MQDTLTNTVMLTDSLLPSSAVGNTQSRYTLRPYQEEAVKAAKRYLMDKHAKKPVLLILPTGSGKSLLISSIAEAVDAPLIVFQPTKEILEQNYNKMMDYGIMGVTIYSASMNRKEIGNITLATIGSVYKKPEDFKHFKYIIIDECFVKGTLVDGIPIEKIKKGDIVRCYNHNKRIIEFKEVLSTFKRRFDGTLIKITTDDGDSFVCTENHPIYTLNYGYISALSLSLCVEKPLLYKVVENESQEDLALYDLREGMSSEKPQQRSYLLQQGVCLGGNNQSKGKGLRYLFNLWKGICIYGAKSYKCTKNWALLLLRGVQQTREGDIYEEKQKTHIGRCENGILDKNENQKSDVDGGRERKDGRVNERENVSWSWRQWRTYQTTNKTIRGNWLPDGISHYYHTRKRTIREFASLLQSRLSSSRSQFSNRGRRQNAQVKEVDFFRQKENRSFKCVRVASVEVYKRGGGREFESVCRDGYVYNFEVKDNNNYFVDNILVHNCHQVNSKGGMYKSFIDVVGEKLIGLTATPYRLSHDGFGGSILKFLTRTNPRIFSKVIHVTQTKDLSNQGYFAKVEYYQIKGFNRSEIKLNSTGADYLEDSEKAYYTKHEFNKQVLSVVQRLLKAGKTRILVFTKFVEEARTLAEELGSEAAMVNGEMKARERDAIIKGFRSGTIKVVANVGVLTVGFDYPELEVVVMARPTRSLNLYYQCLGRCVRPHPNKPVAWVVDMCGNYEIFGKMEDLRLVEFNDNIWYVVSNGRKLTNVYLDEIMRD